MSDIEPCPICKSAANVRAKLVLIDEAWQDLPGVDPREKYFTDMRADDVKPNHLPEEPLEQFLSGFYCDECGKGFISEDILKENRRQYR